MSEPVREQSVVDPAVRQARLVVGLYGDPAVAWSIVLRARLTEAPSSELLEQRWRDLVAGAPGLGRPGTVRSVDGDDQDVLATWADEPYEDRSPLLRVAVDPAQHTVTLAAHHGAVDGLGLLGVLSALLDREVVSSARGVSPGAEPGHFWRAAARRLVEALVRPPVRLASPQPARARGVGDLLVSTDLPVAGSSTAGLLGATAAAVRSFNRARGGRTRPLVLAMGLSRRPGSPTPAPDRDTAYARLECDRVRTVEQARELLAGTRPEPAFPVTDSGGIGPWVTRALSTRLGSTALVSNLGAVQAHGLSGLEFWPVPSGPAGVAVGLASTEDTSTLTVRARRPWFTPATTGELLDLVAREVSAQ